MFIRLTTMNNGQESYNIFINKQSGTVLDFGQNYLEARISQSNINVNKLYFLSPDALIEKIKKEKNNNTPILIGGGDGTIKSCATTLMSKDKPFGVLPLGTMNLLSKDLDIPTQLDKTLHAYKNGVISKKIDVGSVNDEIFLCCASLGAIPAASKFREKHRNTSKPILIPHLIYYVFEQLDQINSFKVKLKMDKHKINLKTSSLVISNNQYIPHRDTLSHNFKRPEIQNGLLGIYSLSPRSMWDKFRLLLKLRFADWKADQALQEWQSRYLEIECPSSSVLLALDGEPKHIKTPLHFKILPKSLKILLPKTKSTNP